LTWLASIVSISIGQTAHMYHDVPVTLAANQLLSMPVTSDAAARLNSSSADVACSCFNETRRKKRNAACG